MGWSERTNETPTLISLRGIVTLTLIFLIVHCGNWLAELRFSADFGARSACLCAGSARRRPAAVAAQAARRQKMPALAAEIGARLGVSNETIRP